MNHQKPYNEILEFLSENGKPGLYLELQDYGFLRLGQRFFMSLNEEMQHKLTMSPYDPFHNDDLTSVLMAVYYLKGLVK